MKPHERRAADAYPYFKLAVWDARSFTFRDGRLAYASEAYARAEACRHGKGRYRVSVVTEIGRQDLDPFNVE